MRSVTRGGGRRGSRAGAARTGSLALLWAFVLGLGVTMSGRAQSGGSGIEIVTTNTTVSPDELTVLGGTADIPDGWVADIVDGARWRTTAWSPSLGPPAEPFKEGSRDGWAHLSAERTYNPGLYEDADRKLRAQIYQRGAGAIRSLGLAEDLKRGVFRTAGGSKPEKTSYTATFPDGVQRTLRWAWLQNFKTVAKESREYLDYLNSIGAGAGLGELLAAKEEAARRGRVEKAGFDGGDLFGIDLVDDGHPLDGRRDRAGRKGAEFTIPEMVDALSSWCEVVHDVAAVKSFASQESKRLYGGWEKIGDIMGGARRNFRHGDRSDARATPRAIGLVSEAHQLDEDVTAMRRKLGDVTSFVVPAHPADCGQTRKGCSGSFPFYDCDASDRTWNFHGAHVIRRVELRVLLGDWKRSQAKIAPITAVAEGAEFEALSRRLADFYNRLYEGVGSGEVWFEDPPGESARFWYAKPARSAFETAGLSVAEEVEAVPAGPRLAQLKSGFAELLRYTKDATWSAPFVGVVDAAVLEELDRKVVLVRPGLRSSLSAVAEARVKLAKQGEAGEASARRTCDRYEEDLEKQRDLLYGYARQARDSVTATQGYADLQAVKEKATLLRDLIAAGLARAEDPAVRRAGLTVRNRAGPLVLKIEARLRDRLSGFEARKKAQEFAAEVETLRDQADTLGLLKPPSTALADHKQDLARRAEEYKRLHSGQLPPEQRYGEGTAALTAVADSLLELQRRLEAKSPRTAAVTTLISEVRKFEQAARLDAYRKIADTWRKEQAGRYATSLEGFEARALALGAGPKVEVTADVLAQLAEAFGDLPPTIAPLVEKLQAAYDGGTQYKKAQVLSTLRTAKSLFAEVQEALRTPRAERRDFLRQGFEYRRDSIARWMDESGYFPKEDKAATAAADAALAQLIREIDDATSALRDAKGSRSNRVKNAIHRHIVKFSNLRSDVASAQAGAATRRPLLAEEYRRELEALRTAAAAYLPRPLSDRDRRLLVLEAKIASDSEAVRSINDAIDDRTKPAVLAEMRKDLVAIQERLAIFEAELRSP